MIENSKVQFKKLGDFVSFFPKSKHSAKFGISNGLYPFFTSSLNINSYVNIPDYNEECLIIGDGGCANINICDKFTASDHCYIFKSCSLELINKYIYYFFRFNIDLLEIYYKGSGLCNISKSNIINLDIPVPDIKIQNKTLKYIKDKDEQIELLKKKIEQLEIEKKEIFKKSFMN